MNKIILLGFISQDPTAKQFAEKNTILSKFSIAVNDMRNYNQSYFLNCVAWNQTAEYINNNLKKGDYVCIDGRITNRSYTNAQGIKAYITEVVVDNIKNLGVRKPKVNENVEHVPMNDFIDKKSNISTDSLNTKTDNQNISNIELETIDWDDDIE